MKVHFSSKMIEMSLEENQCLLRIIEGFINYKNRDEKLKANFPLSYTREAIYWYNRLELHYIVKYSGVYKIHSYFPQNKPILYIDGSKSEDGTFISYYTPWDISILWRSILPLGSSDYKVFIEKIG